MEEMQEELETTAETTASRFAMGRYRTPMQVDGMSDKEFYEFLLEDINIVAKKRAIAFAEWIANRGYSNVENGVWRVGHLLKRTTSDLYKAFLQSQE